MDRTAITIKQQGHRLQQMWSFSKATSVGTEKNQTKPNQGHNLLTFRSPQGCRDFQQDILGSTAYS